MCPRATRSSRPLRWRGPKWSARAVASSAAPPWTTAETPTAGPGRSPRCRPEYIAAFQSMADLATRAGVEGRQRLRIHTPLIALSKREIILTGLSLGLDYALTSSCYDPAPGGEACGRCDACLLRLKGFAEAGTPDPIRYGAGERVSP